MCIPNVIVPVHRAAKSAHSFYETPGNLAAHLSQQWADLYDRGHKIFPAIAGLASLANIYVFWALRDTISQPSTTAASSWSNPYLLAAFVTMSIVPWTAGTMIKTNKKLDSYAISEYAGEAEEVKGTVLNAQDEARRSQADNEMPKLLQKWARLNLIRAVFPLVGAAISFYATMSI